MTKADLANAVSKNSALTKQDAEIIIQTVVDSIIETLKRGGKVELRGFGSFRLRHRNPRTAHNPKTGEVVQIPAKRVPYFKPGIPLLKFINSESSLAKPESREFATTSKRK